MNNEQQYDFSEWLSSLTPIGLNLWREAMAQTRQMHNDVWNGVRFFLTVNGVLMAAIFTMAKIEKKGFLAGGLLGALALVGLVFATVALKILTKQRRYYTEMLLRKTLVEKELGFYNILLSGHDLTFPWKVDQQYVSDLTDDPQRWLDRHQRRKKSISRLIFQVYYGVIVIYGIILLVILFGFMKGCF